MFELVRRRLDLSFGLSATLLLILILFGPVLLWNRTISFRDAAHYYGPLYRHVHEQWHQGVPLWNPFEENGRPLAADPTAAVFYPGKLIFWIVPDDDLGFALYLVLHIALAAINMSLAAKWLDCQPASRNFAALTYAFAGGVVSQYCNPPYLVSAAWLPLAVAGSIQLARKRQFVWVFRLGCVLSLMILGGDPQTAYVALLIGFVSWFAFRWKSRRDRSHGHPFKAHTWLRSAPIQLAMAGAIALLIAAVQILPSWDAARKSDRRLTDTPRSITEAGVHLVRQHTLSLDGMVSIPEPESHREKQYRFSIGPWRWLELFWPNLGGRPYDLDRRWMRVIPAEGGFWSPTLYMGILTVFLAAIGFSVRSSDRVKNALSWIVLFGALGSLGFYGLGWVVDEVRLWCGANEPKLWGPVGGLYWLMSIVLPGFVLFRYPAKLWVFTTCAMSLLAARQIQELDLARMRWLEKCLRVTVAVAFVMIVLLASLSVVLVKQFSHAVSSPLFGPLQAKQALTELILDGFVLSVVAFLFMLACRVWRGKRHVRWIRSVTLITVVELAVAQGWLVPTTDPAVVSPTEHQEALSTQVITAMHHGSYRWPARNWYPAAWRDKPSKDRLGECMAWERLTSRSKYNLLDHSRLANSTAAFSDARHQMLVKTIDAHLKSESPKTAALLAAVGVDTVVSPQWHGSVGGWTSETASDESPWSSDFRRQRAPEGLRFAWIVEEASYVAMPSVQRPDEIAAAIDSVYFSDGVARNLGREVVLETNDVSDISWHHIPSAGMTPGTCQIEEAAYDRFTVRAKLAQPGWLVLRQGDPANWRCERWEADRSVEHLIIRRANFNMQAVHLPAGEHHLRFRYRPTSFRVGAVVSVLSILVLIGMAVRQRSWFGRAPA